MNRQPDAAVFFRAPGLLLSAAAASLMIFPAGAEDAAPAAPAPAVVKAEKLPYPVASPANTGWALQFTHGTPAAVAIKQADGKIKWWWYMTFRVENREEKPIMFIPRIEVVTDTGRIRSCNEPVPQQVYNTVYRICGNALAEPMLKIAGMQHPGKDFIHDSLAIWPAVEGEDVDAFSIYVSGIYGETQPVNDPATGKPLLAPAKDAITGAEKKDKDGQTVMEPVELHRTLRLDYVCPGTVKGVHAADIRLVSSDDVMR